MIRILLIATLLLTQVCLQLGAQNKRTAPYDSLENFLEGDLNLYIGQDLYVKPRIKRLKKLGYDNFYIDYKAKKNKETNVYQCCQVGSDMKTRYESIQGKYFTVIGVVTGKGSNLAMKEYGRDPEQAYYLKLRRKDKGDELYYLYEGYRHKWDFVMNGYWQKSKELLIGNEYVLRGFHDVKNFETNEPVEFVNGQTWTCIDFVLDKSKIDMIMLFQNEKGDIIGQQKNPHFILVWEKYAAIQYEKEMGSSWNTIMESKTELGMTERMVEMSLGKAHQVYHAINGTQWVYDHGVLIMKDGKLIGYE